MISNEASRFERNYGFWNRAEQRAIANTRIALAGAGGDGFQLGISLAMMGVSQFSIADPETFTLENSNRVIGANLSTYGQNKAEVLRDSILNINPSADVRVFNEGVTKENAREFLRGANLVFDESELNYLHVGTLIAREAREYGIPNILVMNLGFAALAMAFRPDSKYTFERMMGIKEDDSLEKVRKQKVPLDRCLPYLPRYGDLETLRAVRKGAALPSIVQGVNVAAALGTTQAFLHITHRLGNRRKMPVWAPRVAYMDAYDLSCGVVRFPRLAHQVRLAWAVARNWFGLNARAGYGEEDLS